MALTKVTKSGITNNAIDADKIEDGTILDTDITPGTITNAKLAGSIANAKLANSSLTINGSSVSLGSSISAGALDWQTVIVADGSTGTTGVAGRGYFIDTTSAAHTFTLPSSPTIGATIAIVDYAGTFATNKLTIARNGHNIQGVANNSLIGTNRASLVLVYVDSTKGWLYAEEHNVADLQVNSFITATGGTVTTSGNFKIHSFTGDGCFVVTTIGAGPAGGPANVDYLVIAGGGGGGAKNLNGGGGGAGGYRTTFPSPGCNAGSFPISTTTYPVTVGAGGAGVIGCTEAVQGSSSIFSTITSAGGGKGGGVFRTPTGYPGGSGGSGGGGGASCADSGTGGAGNTPPVSPSQGNPGGTASSPLGPSYAAAGGGGAGAAGTNSSGATTGGPGGDGLANSITGTSITRGGGGGAASDPPRAAGTGGSGGGGSGFSGCGGGSGTAGTPNTGSGGGGGTGGGTGQTGGTGGKGIVIIRYKFQ